MNPLGNFYMAVGQGSSEKEGREKGGIWGKGGGRQRGSLKLQHRQLNSLLVSCPKFLYRSQLVRIVYMCSLISFHTE